VILAYESSTRWRATASEHPRSPSGARLASTASASKVCHRRRAISDRTGDRATDRLRRSTRTGPPHPTFIPPRPTDRGCAGAHALIQNRRNAGATSPAGSRVYGAPSGSSGAEAPRRARRVARSVTLLGASAIQACTRSSAAHHCPRSIAAAGRHSRATPAGLLIGGYFGSCAATALLRPDRALQRRARPKHGASLGLAGIRRRAAGRRQAPCAVPRPRRLVANLPRDRDTSPPPCGPLRPRHAAIARTLHGDRRGQALAQRLRRPAALERRAPRPRRPAYRPNGLVNFVSSALRVFAADFDDHARPRHPASAANAVAGARAGRPRWCRLMKNPRHTDRVPRPRPVCRDPPRARSRRGRGGLSDRQRTAR